MSKNKSKIIITVLLIIIGMVSVFGITKKTTDPEMHKKTIEALDDKKTTVLKMTASSAAASTALAAIPGDATTPVANKLADLSSYFLAILTVVFLEKYLVTLTGYVTFQFLIPIACVLLIIAVWNGKAFLKVLAAKIALFGMVIFLIIPVSMKVSTIIEETNKVSAENTMEEANELADKINNNVDSDGNILDRFIKKVKGGVSGLKVKGEALLNNFIEMIAVMLVTSCVIPIVVLMFTSWFMKILFGVQINVPFKFSQKRNKEIDVTE